MTEKDEAQSAARLMWRYVGDGSSSPSNVPARDLTDEDWDAFDEVQRASVRVHSDPSPTAAAHQLYEEVVDTSAQRTKRKA